jgi:hypothetical protein
MFIAQFKDGSQLKGDKVTWDDVPSSEENHITGLHLTLPFKGHMKDSATGQMVPMPARIISLGVYNRYYTAKEAVASFGDKAGGEANVVAEIMGGVDDKHGVVMEVRVGKDGNISMRHFPVSQLTHAPHAVKAGKALKKSV